jgi:RNA polymerase sigma-70 factor (ECF subfamily)
MQITQANIPATAEAVREFEPQLGQIFLEHKDRIFRAAYRITGNAGDAEDVLQTVFLRLVRHERFPEIGNLAAYLHRSAVNASLDLLRSRKDARSVSLDGVGAADDELPRRQLAVTEDTVEPSAEIRDWLRQALGRLNPRWAEMFVLRFIEDYSNREIAKMMKTSAAVVAVVLHRTRTQLKKDYKESARGRR